MGADRIAANGDIANKIGTYSLAVLAHEHGIPFYVAAPTSTIDLHDRRRASRSRSSSAIREEVTGVTLVGHRSTRRRLRRSARRFDDADRGRARTSSTCLGVTS